MEPDFDGWMRTLVEQVPRGGRTTAGALARALGDGAATAAVAGWVGDHPGSVDLLSEGQPGAFEGFHGSPPLGRLQGEQRDLAKLVRIEPPAIPSSRVTCMDVAYRGAHAAGAAVEVDLASGDPPRTWTVEAEAHFPYIPGYLYYREGPVLLRLAHGQGPGPGVLCTDGHGILHPRGCGLASHLGVVLDAPTVGVAKGPLPGATVRGSREWRSLKFEGRPIGWVHRRGSMDRWITPGHRMDPPGARRVVEALDASPGAILRRAHTLAAATMASRGEGKGGKGKGKGES